MPRAAKELTDLEVRRLKPRDGRGSMVAVGGVAGLYMQILPTGGRTWILRTRVGDKTRDIGLGGYPSVTLSMARGKAREARTKIEQGVDPVEERKAARAALVAARKRGISFRDAVDRFCEVRLGDIRGERNKAQWRSALDRYAAPEIGDMLVSDVTPQDVLRVLEPIWQTKTETARKLRIRLEAVLDWAKAHGHREGENPAAWKGNLKAMLPDPGKVAKGDNQPALALAAVSVWWAALRQRDGTGARALEFLTLTAARSGEVRGATWDEMDGLDGNAPMWVIPAARMKMGREHRVPLPPSAVALLKALPRFADNPLVFPAARGGQLSDMTLSATMRRMHADAVEEGGKGWLDPRSGRAAVPHGLRSTFRDWTAERGFDRDMAEIALAHNVGTEVERAYRRSDMVERRRAMMAAWSAFLEGVK